MRYLLDTHAFIWFMTGSLRLSLRARGIIESPDSQIFVSAVSIYEIELQLRLNRMRPFPVTPTDLVEQFGYIPLPITQVHAERAGRLPLTHRDPWDRILAAQSISEVMPIISRDIAISELGAEVIW